MKKIYLSLLATLFVFLAYPGKTLASQGIFELKNQVGEAAVCHATSGIMEDQRYNILTLCQNILYPGGTQVYHYIAWINPTEGGNAIRLGEIGLGKKLFKANVAFSTMFVTKELQSNPRTPTGTVVMRGNFQDIQFLKQNEATTTSVVNNTGNNNDNELIEASPTPTASPAPADNNNIFRIVAAGGIVAFLGLFGVILIIFVISRR